MQTPRQSPMPGTQDAPFSVYAMWERLGVTEHPGGIASTRRLIDRCRLAPGQRVLEIGCGSGHTACLLARRYRCHVTATDISAALLERAARRVSRAGLGEAVTLRTADAHALPFPDATFDAVIAESVLVFCDAARVATEVRRVLTPASVFGLNELTYRKPPPAQLRALLESAFGAAIRPLFAREWSALMRGAGFPDVSVETRHMHLVEQLYSHLRIDGVRTYASAAWHSIADASVRRAFFTREMVSNAMRFPSYIGYGLYVGRST